MNRALLGLLVLSIGCVHRVETRSIPIDQDIVSLDEGAGGPGPRGASILSLMEGQATLGAGPGNGSLAFLRITAPASGQGIVLNASARICMDSICQLYMAADGDTFRVNRAGTDMLIVNTGVSVSSPFAFVSTIASGSNGFSVSTGARYDMGGGTDDYLVGDGTAVTTTGYGVGGQKSGAGAPTAGDCDAAAEKGRFYHDTTNNRLYFCAGATRLWDYVTLTD